MDSVAGSSEDIRSLADKNFQLLKSNSRHPSLHLKRIEELWSARVGGHYRVLGFDVRMESLAPDRRSR